MSPTPHRRHMSVLCENSICWIWEPQTCPEWYFDVENGPRRSVWLRKLILLLIPSGGVVDGHSQRNLIRKHPCQGERWVLEWGGRWRAEQGAKDTLSSDNQPTPDGGPTGAFPQYWDSLFLSIFPKLYLNKACIMSSQCCVSNWY